MTTDAPDYNPEPVVLTHERFGAGARPGGLKGSGSDGTFGGMDPWQQTVETRLGELRGDVRQVLYATIGGAAFVLAAFAGGFLVLSNKVDAAANRVESRIESLSSEVAETNERVARIEGDLQSRGPRTNR
jgi:hypothetical protein